VTALVLTIEHERARSKLREQGGWVKNKRKSQQNLGQEKGSSKPPLWVLETSTEAHQANERRGNMKQEKGKHQIDEKNLTSGSKGRENRMGKGDL